MSHRVLAVYSAQASLTVIGLALSWRIAFSPRARLERPPSQLAPWTASTIDLLYFCLAVVIGAFLGGTIASVVASPLGITGDRFIILGSGATQTGLLLGAVMYWISYPQIFAMPAMASPRVVWSGIVTFLVSLPFVYGTAFVWIWLLEAAGLPIEKQDAIDLFLKTKSPGWLTFFGFTAVIIAPLSEELIFRAGLFRFFRTRIPRWAALILPACLFATLHRSLASFGQLVALAIVFSLAYERTGRIGTSMVAHALFNLNTIVFLLAGVVI
jgi:uncharacterized protein